ncbi:hypothetical protein ABCS64_06580 [Rhodocyclaceae bacterium Wk13]|uniref:Secreted protein n=1 Tax=Dentiradicibacter hellwigii TaxID=3149053 RepID=A0ABV4UEA9_9RHOO
MQAGFLVEVLTLEAQVLYWPVILLLLDPLRPQGIPFRNGMQDRRIADPCLPKASGMTACRACRTSPGRPVRCRPAFLKNIPPRLV